MEIKGLPVAVFTFMRTSVLFLHVFVQLYLFLEYHVAFRTGENILNIFLFMFRVVKQH